MTSTPQISAFKLWSFEDYQNRILQHITITHVRWFSDAKSNHHWATPTRIAELLNSLPLKASPTLLLPRNIDLSPSSRVISLSKAHPWFIMDRIIRPVARQLLRPRPRYPFSIPPTAHAQRLYSMKHSAPQVRPVVGCDFRGPYWSVTVERPVAVHSEGIH